MINILNEYIAVVVINGILYKNRTMDSKFTFVPSSGSSEIDLVVCNNVESFEINDKLRDFEYCPCTINIVFDLAATISIINECTCGFKAYDHYDVGKNIKNVIYINRLNFDSLENDFILGEDILNKYRDPSQELINKFTSELTSVLYSYCIDNYIPVDHKRRNMHLTGVNSDQKVLRGEKSKKK